MDEIGEQRAREEHCADQECHVTRTGGITPPRTASEAGMSLHRPPVGGTLQEMISEKQLYMLRRFRRVRDKGCRRTKHSKARTGGAYIVI